MTTIYEHDGKEIYKDEADEYDAESIRTHYGQFDKRLLTATYTVIKPEKEGDPTKVVFAKKTGTKGLTPHQIVSEALLNLQPANLAALSLLDEFLSADLPDPAELLRRSDEIEAAMHQLLAISKASQGIVERCLTLQPVPAAHNLIPGF